MPANFTRADCPSRVKMPSIMWTGTQIFFACMLAVFGTVHVLVTGLFWSRRDVQPIKVPNSAG